MARKQRVPKSLKDKIRDLDHHQFLLRQSLHGLPREPAYLKSIAAELRTLICLSSGTEGLLWRLADELNVSDAILLEAAFSVRKDHPLSVGLQFATVPLNRPGTRPPGIVPELHSLREIIKKYQAVHLSSISDDLITHEYLIKAIAEQMGSAHEDDGIEPMIMRLQRIFAIGVQSYTRVLAFDAELTLQIGERILDHAERAIGYKRLARRECGNVSFVLRFRPNEDIIVQVPLTSIKSKISEAEISVGVRRKSILIDTRKHGVTGPTMEIGHRANPETRDDVLVAFTYSSLKRQARAIVIPGDSQSPIGFDLGWLDASEMTPTSSEVTCEPFLTLRYVILYERLLSTSDCESLMHLSPDVRDMPFQKSNEDEFPA